MGWWAGYSIECKFAAALTLSFRIFEIKIYDTRKYPLRGYFLGVLTHTTAWD